MSKYSSEAAVQNFVNLLEHSGLKKRLNLSDEDIADTLWLALQMGIENTTQIIEKSPQLPTETIPENPSIEPVEPVEPSINLYTPSSDLLPEESENEEKNQEKVEGLPFQAPAAPALPNKLQISRALRPLKRKVPSYSRRTLDVEATVNRIVDGLIAEQEIWIPVTKPQPERWLNLELVIEENRASFIWQETINELAQILENYGIFRAVRTWNLLGDGDLQLISRKKGKPTKYHEYNYRELYHGDGRGLILLVSDCVSPIWQQETIYHWLEKWSNQCPTAIMHLFPERLWLSSELGLGYKVKLSAFNPGVPNSKLICREDLDIDQVLKLPIVTLEAESLKEWAKVVAGYGKSQTAAIVLDLEFVQSQLVNKSIISQSLETSPEAIVDRFLATASPIAQKLAGLMAAVPVSLPVVHLIQKTMLPNKSTPVNVAEVFLSGMIARNNDEYDFVVGVRKLLNQAMRLTETEQVLDVVSAYIAEKMGLSMKNFTALLLNLPDLSQAQQANLLPFAHVTVEVLKNLGGRYAEFAEEVETNKSIFKEIPDFPTFQPFQFELATINLQPFKFEVATIKPKQTGGWLGFGQKTKLTVKHRRQQAYGFTEDLGNEIVLEIVQIPGGKFMMGAPKKEKDSSNSERPQHQVNVPTFFMGKYAVTQAQWKAVAALPQINRELKPDPSNFKGVNRPVEQVSWYDAVEFCDRLSQYTGRRYSLPSEAEWGYGCRAGTTTPFYFGKTITSELANYNAKYTYGAGVKGTYRQETTEVGSFGVANAFGLYDMHGNVWEWCLDDWHDNYEGAPTDGSAWIDKNDNRSQTFAVLRGGSWDSNPVDCRSASRYGNYNREYRSNVIGFRVVCAAGRIL